MHTYIYIYVYIYIYIYTHTTCVEDSDHACGIVTCACTGKCMRQATTTWPMWQRA